MFGLPLSEMQGRPIGTLVPELRDLVAIQALFDPGSWPVDRQLDTLDAALRTVMAAR